MAVAIFVVSILIGVGLLIDQGRRPPSEWTAADRDRGWWMWATALASLFGLGIIALVVYLVGVRPGFVPAHEAAGSFRKRSAATAVPLPLPEPPAQPPSTPQPPSNQSEPLWAPPQPVAVRRPVELPDRPPQDAAAPSGRIVIDAEDL